MTLHVLLSLLAASLLTLAAGHSLLLAVQERFLHRPGWESLLCRLPPLQSMERGLFLLIGAGFLSLSASLLTGLWFIENWFAQHLIEKTTLSIAAWLVFGLLLWGRSRYGWRGEAATRWVISGYTLLLVAYFGSKYVIKEIIYKTTY